MAEANAGGKPPPGQEDAVGTRTVATGLPTRVRRYGRACFRVFVRAFFVFGLVSLSFVLGAGALYFDQPPARFLRRAFEGAGAWYESKPVVPGPTTLPALLAPQVDRPEKTCDGFTLLMYHGDCRALLVNMHGKVVHEWHVPFSQMWPEPAHLKGRIDDATVYFNDGYLFPNGDLVAVVEGPTSTANPSNGYGLVKLDKDSHILWKYAERCHHDVDVAEDGTIYTIVNDTVDRVPTGLEDIPTPCLTDVIDVLAADGTRRQRIRLLDAFAGTPYVPLLAPLARARFGPGTGAGATAMSMYREDEIRRDVLHTNAVRVLPRAQTLRFPLFKEGQLIVSPRRLDALAVVDPHTEKVVWACRGPWKGQHDPTFLENGHLLLFDNFGSPAGSRVLEYDPATQSFPWSYPGESGKPFFSPIRGMCQRLANGNTLVVNSVGGELFEVTPDREVVWSWSSGEATINRARRYRGEQVPFVKGSPRAAP